MDEGGLKSTISRMVERSRPKVMEMREPFFRAPRVLAAWQPGSQWGEASGLASRVKTFSRGAAMGADKVVDEGRMKGRITRNVEVGMRNRCAGSLRRGHVW